MTELLQSSLFVIMKTWVQKTPCFYHHVEYGLVHKLNNLFLELTLIFNIEESKYMRMIC